MAISIADTSYSPTRSPLGLLMDPEKANPRPKQSMWHRLGLRRLLGRDDRDVSPKPSSGASSPTNNHPKPHDNLTRRLSRRVGVGLPRSATFRRQNSERRDRLAPLDPEPRRAVSADRRRAVSAQRSRSPQPPVDPRLSAPEVQWRVDPEQSTVEEPHQANDESDFLSEWNPTPDVTDVPEPPAEDTFDMELEQRWILNLSMHFRDRSEREKFFVTYAEAPNKWRRVTISCDYRDAPPDSLEQDLKELRYQRDKCARIYESIRESLADIQFYDTVTNLKLETRDGRLHVHVTEDVNEIIPYPPISCIGHLPEARLVPEHRLNFEMHLSGFVYNVNLDGKNYIKKEIPGPDTVDEFLYEINALHALSGTPNVVQVEGIVVDDRREIVKGLLISFAEQGALVDILYEKRGTISWERRERWARQIVQGLCEIHEAGYVQGDFTLSNIVVDAQDNAKIIDINRRGCPVGWEPPEIAKKIESNQRISMYIGVKTDLYQLGMTLWALATEEDEPERQPRPLEFTEDMKVPDYYQRLVSVCLSRAPRNRLSAKELLSFFPRNNLMMMGHHFPPMHPPPTGLSVGLHNGSLPFYTPRAFATPTNFYSPRARSINSDHPDHATAPLDDRHSLYDHSPQFGPPFSERDSFLSMDDERFLRTNGTTESVQEPGPAINFNEPQISNDLPTTEAYIDLPLHIDLEDSQGHWNDGSHYHEENDIDLDASVDPSYRKSSVDQAADLMPFQVDHLPGELAGVGGHPACSLGHPSTKVPSPDCVEYQGSSGSSTTTQSTDPYPTPMADLGHPFIHDQNWTSQVRPSSASSLLHSILPINPALSFSEQKLIETNASRFSHLGLRSAFSYSRQGLPEHSPYLSDSHLPINPAFAEKALASL